MHRHHEHDEHEVGKVIDLNILVRLFGFMKPYLKYLVLAAVLLVFAAGAELIYPYLTKVAIDEYIIKTGKKVTNVSPVEGFIPLDDTTYFALQSVLEGIDAQKLKDWEDNGNILDDAYYYLFTGNAEETALGVVYAHEEIFERYDNLVIARYTDMKALPAQEIAQLRSRDIMGVVRVVAFFLFIVILGAFAGYGQIYSSQYAGQLFMHLIRTRVFEKLQQLHLAFFDRNPVGRLVTRATNDIEAINEAFTQVFAQLLRQVLLLVGIIITMLVVNTRLAVIAFAVIPVLLFVTFYFRIKARKIFREVRLKLARLNARLQENLSGIRIIKIFIKEKQNLSSFDRVNRDYLNANLKHVVLMSYFRPLIEIISSVGIGLVLYYGGGQVITSKVSLGVLVAFITYVQMFFRPIRELTESYTLLQSAMASSERIFMLLDEKIEITARKDAVPMTTIRGEIEFNHVWFRYDKDWVLKDISFKVHPGEHVAFVGPTGSGKTSIISLISRLYEIQRGTILVDGTDIRDICLPSLRSKIGVVPQDVFLFAGDIKSNIRLNLALPDERIEEIASYINADRFINRFPNCYGQDVAERGVTFTAGERQLLSFARALAFDPRILVLDEATANIDAETEHLIQDGLKKLISGRTAIIVAHRLSTIKDVDRIYVVHSGEIREAGNHTELIKTRGLYYNLYQLQSLQR
ncbi:MAG: ABC transporter ATP-binding protein [candidate division WOR-3 bacterium]|nr:MAG: ABC transporter ATP-binding protein [candidate division WOR-3 bacterium]